jgi:hypothetical protein
MLLFSGAVSVSADTFNIEIDWMETTGHSHKPSAAVIDAVVQAFACEGHTLNIDVDENIGHCNVLRRNPNDCDASLFSYDDNTICSFDQIKDTYFDHAGQSGWFYGVFAHQYENTDCETSGSSGLSNGGTYFIVTMGSFSGQVGTPFDNAATLMHEFGHNLGLSHCGNMYCGGDDSDPDYVGPYVPNMPSTMSYDYQLAGVETNLECHGLSIPDSLFKEIDFSHGRMCGQNELDLDEFFGSGMVELDWDCDGTLESSEAWDITDRGSWCNSSGNMTNVFDYNEWANLSPGAAIAAAAESGDFRNLEEADFVFVDPAEPEEVARIAEGFLRSNKRPDLRGNLVTAAETGDVDFLYGTRVLTFDPFDEEKVREFARDELERRRIQNDEQPCISADEWAQINGPRSHCDQPTLATESCINGENVYVGDLVCLPIIGCIEVGICAFPWSTVAGAQAASPSNSTYYLKPGTWNETNGLLLNKNGTWTCERSDGTGSAVIK